MSSLTAIKASSRAKETEDRQKQVPDHRRRCVEHRFSAFQHARLNLVCGSAGAPAQSHGADPQLPTRAGAARCQQPAAFGGSRLTLGLGAGIQGYLQSQQRLESECNVSLSKFDAADNVDLVNILVVR
jgi:hypothetical protein